MQCSVPLKGRVSQKNFLSFKRTQEQRSNRQAYICQNALLDFFKGGKTSSGAAEIVDQIIKLSRPTYAGVFAGQKRKQQIAELVDELSDYRLRAPTRSPNFWGLFELIYTETPFDIAGPFRKPPALLVLQSQRLYQYLDKNASTIISYNSFKPLGILQGSTKLMGRVEIPSADQYRANFSHLKIDLGVGGVREKQSELSLLFDIIYQDDRIRVFSLVDSNEFSIVERVDPQETGIPLDSFAFEQPSGEYAEEEEEEEVEVQEEQKLPSFLSFAQNGRKMGSGTISISNRKQVVGSGTVRLAQDESASPMDQVRSAVKMYQQQVKEAKESKKGLSQSVKDLQRAQSDLMKQSEKLQQQVNRTEVELENAQLMLQQINDEENESLKQLQLLQNKLQQLNQAAAASSSSSSS